MRINNHRLIADDGTPVRYVETPNKGGVMTPEYLVMHYTAGSSAESAAAWLCNPANGGGYHSRRKAEGDLLAEIEGDGEGGASGGQRASRPLDSPPGALPLDPNCWWQGHKR